jgi:hypothetical protein
MGLEMYLYGRRYLSSDMELYAEISNVTEGIRNGFHINFITVDLMYWSKANAIHNWFIKHVQNGQHTCGQYPVSEENLLDLLRVVTEVLDDHSKADKLLPTQSGFFWGNAEYDDWYFEYLQYTKDKLTDLFGKFKEEEIGPNWTFEYCSSW